MANRRMFSLDVVDTDRFLEMPVTTQALYFHLGMRADDDGFVSSPKRITTLVGCNEDDLKLLIAKQFVIPFESGIVVISDWNVNNWVRPDRKHETRFTEEKKMLSIRDDIYVLVKDIQPNDNQMTTERHTEVRLGKDSIDKSNIYSANFDAFWKVYPRKKEKAKAYKAYNARLKDGFSDDELLKAATAYAEECKSRNTEERYIKLGATFLSANTPFEDYLKEGEEDGQSIAQRKENVPEKRGTWGRCTLDL